MTETQLSMKSLNGHTNEAVSASTFHIHITHMSSIISCMHNTEKTICVLLQINGNLFTLKGRNGSIYFRVNFSAYCALHILTTLEMIMK